MEHLFQKRILEHYPKLTPSQMALSRYILENIEEIPFLSITALSNKIPISESTITRFCAALGYSGYSDFQKDMQRWIQLKITPSERLKKTSRMKRDNLFWKAFNTDIQNLRGTLEELSLADVHKAIQLLIYSQNIFIIGLRSSFGLAYYLHHQLSKISQNTILLDAAHDVLFDPVVNIGPKDALVAISFHPYSKKTLQVAEYCKEQGCRIVAITDTVLSPLSPISDFLIRVKINSDAFFKSHTAACCVVNCLISGISMGNSQKSIKALKEIEAKLPRWETWIDSADRNIQNR